MSYLYILPQTDNYVKFLTSYINLKIVNLMALAKEDILLLNKDKILISDIKEIIQFVNLKPVKSQKLVVLGPFENVTIEAQNAFLKTLEEPPNYCTIILYAFSLQKILDTIKSRCQIINLRAKNNLYLQEQNQINKLINNNFSLLKLFKHAPNITLNQLLGIIKQLKNSIEQKNIDVSKKTRLLKYMVNLEKALSVNSSIKNIYELLILIKDLYEV